LVPEDLGLVAMAMSIIALVELASSFSFETVLIQQEQPTCSHYDTAWTLNVLFGASFPGWESLRGHVTELCW
jgi:O-antigen/teichoic acid export membrane protein